MLRGFSCLGLAVSLLAASPGTGARGSTRLSLLLFVGDGLGHLALSLIHVSLLYRLLNVITDSIHGGLTVLLLLNLAKLDDKHLTHGVTFCLFVLQHRVDDSRDLVEDCIFALIAIHFLEQVVLALLDTKACEPGSQAILLHIEANHAVNKRAGVIPVLVHGFQSFA